MRSTSAARRVLSIFGVVFVLFASVSLAKRTEQATEGVTLAWDASNGANGYRVHVGTESRAYDQSYDAGRATSFVFADGLPGTRYFFAVTAYDAAGRESSPSNEVSIALGAEPDPPVGSQSCASSIASACSGTRARAETSADTLGTVRGMAVLPDERVMFVEDARRVRVLGPAGLGAVPSLHAENDTTEFTELVVDPFFTRTAWVFVGMTERQRDGRREFRVVRYRFVHDTLGEGVTIVGGLSFRGDHSPRFTMDDLGRVYVAMPGLSGARTDPFAGRLLRFAADGSVPRDHRGFSPVFAESFPVPFDLDWDGTAVWIGGLDEHSQPALARLLPNSVDIEWPRRLSDTGLDFPPGLDVFAFDVTEPNAANRSSAHPVIIDTTRRLHRVTTHEGESAARVEAMDWSAVGEPVDVALGPHGSIHVVIRTDTGAFAVLKVTDRQ